MVEKEKYSFQTYMVKPESHIEVQPMFGAIFLSDCRN